MKNDPSFHYTTHNDVKTSARQNKGLPGGATISNKKTEVTHDVGTSTSKSLCPFHLTLKRELPHTLNECVAFRRKSLDDRKRFVRENGICFKCCGDKKHRAKNCKASVKCGVCKSDAHATAFHDSNPNEPDSATDKEQTEVKSICTQICQTTYGTSKSCAKILPVKVYPENNPHNSRTIYALVDDQSSHSLATPSFFDAFSEHGPQYQYVLVSCAGKKPNHGRRADGYVIQSVDNASSLKLPTLIECTDIPNNRNEIPSPEIAEHFSHLRDIAEYIPPIDSHMDIELLIGRDLIAAHHVLEQRVGEDRHPLGQKLPLGWVILGEVCMDKVHLPETVNVNKTFILASGRPSYFQPCENKLSVDPFQKTENDEKTGLSIEDRMFLQLMDSDFQKGHDGRWIAPLPFRTDRSLLPDNKYQAEKRAKALDSSLRRNPTKRKHGDFMQKIFDRGHAERAPSIPPDKERWFLPMFGVYHPKKPDSIRVVFYSSARHQGVSLNDVLLKGPDLSNSLQGILLRFRRERIAMTADVEQMFHNFHVCEDHRDFLRFLWHPNNDLDASLEEYRMTVHVFGNSPSPAIATYGLRKSVEHADLDVNGFVDRNFYVDDGLALALRKLSAL
ncbi:uncharacterized protein LOC132545277 [Ylistrum balloti]|uniref:uncharacterized protein LOC132545277 n=1 Tax=Ylistrum balloti TaxID=509963 RepID=UPI0029059021|nr:uncharacterized protein LOC132545277 [Ylistrum balloti]